MAEKWAHYVDPEDAAAWGENLPNGETKTAALHGLILQWTSDNQAGATDWGEGLPEGKTKADALHYVAKVKAILEERSTAIP